MKMKTSFIILLILSCQICQAQTRITGTIRGTDGKTIPAVNIYIKGTLDGSTSDSSGNYSIITSVKGNQILIASMIGMETCSIAINLDEKQQLQNITLSAAI